MISHEVYLETEASEMTQNGALSALQNLIVEKSDAHAYHDRKLVKFLHMTIAFATSMPMNEVNAVIKEIPTPIKTDLVFDRLEVMGNRVALVASNVPDDLQNYALSVQQIMRNHGCEVSYPGPIKAHVSILSTKDLRAGSTPKFLKSIEEEMKPIVLSLQTYKLIDRTTKHTVLWER